MSLKEVSSITNFSLLSDFDQLYYHSYKINLIPGQKMAREMYSFVKGDQEMYRGNGSKCIKQLFFFFKIYRYIQYIKGKVHFSNIVSASLWDYLSASHFCVICRCLLIKWFPLKQHIWVFFVSINFSPREPNVVTFKLVLNNSSTSFLKSFFEGISILLENVFL